MNPEIVHSAFTKLDCMQQGIFLFPFFSVWTVQDYSKTLLHLLPGSPLSKPCISKVTAMLTHGERFEDWGFGLPADSERVGVIRRGEEELQVMFPFMFPCTYRKNCLCSLLSKDWGKFYPSYRLCVRTFDDKPGNSGCVRDLHYFSAILIMLH